VGEVEPAPGLTGMRILRDIAAGQIDPERLAAHRHTRIRASQQEIADSLRGHYRDEHVFQLRQALQFYDFYQQRVMSRPTSERSLGAP